MAQPSAAGPGAGLPRVSPAVAGQLTRACREAWRVEGSTVMVRGARPTDMAAIAALHGRCSPTTLLQRYRAGGRPPSLDWTNALLRVPLCLVVVDPRRPDPVGPHPRLPAQVVALAWAVAMANDAYRAEMGLLVEDAWQGRGIGSALARRLGSTLRARGCLRVTTRSATPTVPLHRVMEQLGTVRLDARGPEAVLTAALLLSPVDAIDPSVTWG